MFRKLMSSTRSKRRSRIAGAMLATAALGAVRSAHAAPLSYDLRFEDGSHVKAPSPGAYKLELWARLSGANANHADDGLESSYIEILSSEIGGGGTIGGLANGAVVSQFQSFSGATPLYRDGSGSDLNSDGIIDWGSGSTDITNTNYMFARAGDMIYGGGTVGDAVDANTWEFDLATFDVFFSGGVFGFIGFHIQKPNATGSPPVTYAVGKIDGRDFTIDSADLQGAYANSLGVIFATPEPGTLAILSVGALWLGRQRR